MGIRAHITFSKYGRRTLLAIGISLALTAVAWYAVKVSVDLYDLTRFDAVANEIRDDISFQMQTYENALTQAKGMYNASQEVTREEFREYVRTVRLLEKYPGIQGIGYAERIPAYRLKSHIEQVRRSGYAEYNVWPDTPRSEYFSIVYLEPSDWRNQRAFGYDMHTEASRRAAMDAARDTGEPAATAKVTLVQETADNPQSGFLIYVPIYLRGAITNTVEERRAALVGFVYSPFRSLELFRGIVSSRETALPIDFEVYDGAVPAAENVLFDLDGELHLNQRGFNPRFQETTELNVAGRPWRLVVYSLPAFNALWSDYLPTAVLLVGLAVTFLIGKTLRANQKELELSRQSDLLLESMSDGVSMSDENGIITYTNPAQDRMFGYAPGELVGKHVSVQSAHPPGESRRVVLEVSRALRTNDEWSGEFRNKRKDGTQFTTFARITSLDVDGKRSYVCVQRDITEGKRAEQALRESEERFRQMADQAPIMIWLADVDKSCYYVNKPWLDFTGRSLEQELGRNWTEGMHPQDLKQAVQTYESSFDARSVFSMEYRLRRHDGVYRWILDHGVPRFTGDGEFLGYIGSCMDITDRKEFEQQLQEAITARDAFLSVVSHELRTPITTLKLQGQIRKKNLQAGRVSAFTEDKLTKMVDIDNRQIERLHRLVDEMLDISRISTGRFAIQPEAVDLCALVREVIERLDPQLEAAGCPISVDAPAQLIGKWDHFRIEQVLVNLLTNAIKYGPGKPIAVGVMPRQGWAVLEVCDHGIGIAPEDQQRIFERYERVTSKGQISGLGIGLYIVQEILDAHGGSIRVRSALGQGATFTVELPLTADVEDRVSQAR